MDKNLKMGPRAEEKFEKRGLKRTKSWDLKSVGPQHPLKRTEFGRSKSGSFVVNDYFL